MYRLLCLFAAIWILTETIHAQDTRGTIQGSVMDSQGGVVGGVDVVVTNVETGVPLRLKSNETGRYQAVLLLPGRYSVSAEVAGFKKAVRDGITLEVSDVRQVDFVLELGGVTESVTVNSEAPLLDVTRTDAGRALDERSVQDLPVMANTVFTMIQYSAGVQTGGPPALLGPHSTQGGSDYNNGTGVGGNTWTIDGAINNGNARFTANLPAVESVAETKVLTTTFDGNFGHSTGLGIAVSTKTGSNDFHGTVSENYWNQRWLGANLFTKKNYYSQIAVARAAGNTALADQLASQPIQPAGHSNLWALNLTGPVIVPKLFNGRNKVFFSFNYNGEKDAKPEDSSTYNRVVPTIANKNGDFSDLLKVSSNPQQYQLYDPLSVRPDPARPGHYIRTPLAGNILPPSYIAMGQKFYKNYVKYWPDPNNWFDPRTTPNNNPYLSVHAPYNWTYSQFAGRMDVNLGDRMRMFGRYSQNHFVEFRGDWTIDILPGLNNQNIAGSGVTRDDQNGVLDWVYTVNSNTILHAAASVSNWDSLASVRETPFTFKPSDVGLPQYLDDKCALTRCYLPLMNVTGYSQNGIGGIPAPIYNRFWTYTGDVFHNRGNHALKFGADIREQVRSIKAGNNDGQYTFGNTYFRKCDDACGDGTYTAGGIGLSWASFMMGLPTAISISGNDSAIVANPFYGFYGQDTWRVLPKLTLTLSLRAEFEQGATERFNRLIIDYDKNAVLPISTAAEAAYAKNPIPELPASQFKVLGGAVYAGAPGAPRRAWGSQLMWLPRIGFGYQVDSKTVFRGGYGIYYDTLDVNAISFGGNQTGFSRGTSTTISTDQGVNWLAGDPFNFLSPLNDPFPVRASAGGTRFDTPLRTALGNMALVGAGWTYMPSKHSRQQRWRASIERQIGTSNVVSVAYEGTYTSNLNINVTQSGLPSTFYSKANVRDAVQDSNLTAQVTNPFNIANFASLAATNPIIYQDMTTKTFFTSATIAKSTLLRPYPNGNISVGSPIGKARSSQIEFSFNRRFSKGLTANFAYTGMIAKQATTLFQPWDPNDSIFPQVPNWLRNGASPQRVAATWVYDLPFGPNRQWVHSRIPGLLASGWTISGTYQYQPGNLLGFGNAFYYGTVNDIKIDNPTLDRWFNTDGCVTSNPGPGDIVVPTGQPCTQGWDKRAGSQPATFQARQFPVNIDGLRGPAIHQTNLSLMREIRIRERLRFQARVDALNVMNHSFFGGVNTTPSSAQFGQITSGSVALNRFVQIQGHLRW